MEMTDADAWRIVMKGRADSHCSDAACTGGRHTKECSLSGILQHHDNRPHPILHKGQPRVQSRYT
jgi:hypothetical protein